LGRAFSCDVGMRKSLSHCCGGRKDVRTHRSGRDANSLERLQLWTRDGTASAGGAAFAVVIITVQFILSINTGFLYVHPWARTSPGQKIRLGTNAVFQVGCALFTAGPAANDVLHGFGIAVVFALEGAATLCLLGSTVVMDGDGSSSADATSNASASAVNMSLLASNGSDMSAAAVNTSSLVNNASDLFATAANASAGEPTDENEQFASIAQALQLATISASLLSLSIFVPLGLTVYDGVLVPIAVHVGKHEGTIAELVCALLVSLVVMPIQVAKFFFGINAEVADIASEYTDSSKEMAFTGQGNLPEEPQGYRRDAVVPLTPAMLMLNRPAVTESSTLSVEEYSPQAGDDTEAPIPKKPRYAHKPDPVGLSETQAQEWRLAEWHKAAECQRQRDARLSKSKLHTNV